MRKIMIVKQDEQIIGKRIHKIVDECLEIDIGGIRAGLMDNAYKR